MKKLSDILGLASVLLFAFSITACDDGNSSKAEDFVESSSSEKLEESSSSEKLEEIISSSSDITVSSSSVEDVSSSETRESIPYTTKCPEGHTCVYAPTKQLNPKINYGEFVDERDYQVYKTITIGTQTWMAQNLNYAYRQPTAELDSSSICYNNDPEKCAEYGRLYLWSAAMDSASINSAAAGCGNRVDCDQLTADALAQNPIRGICPEGWHLPSYAEWDTLRNVAGGWEIAGKALKSAISWYDNGNGTDDYGFSALAAATSFHNESFSNENTGTRFWSASYESKNYYFADMLGLTYNKDYALLTSEGKNLCLSVRCIKD